ncbi:putative peptidase [Anoxybacillus sp. BCO1]|nr:putative peptidase [Anoxybacillus sp. BCO1]
MDKVQKLRAQFAEHGIDGFLITNEYNRRYMTNFTGTAGVVLISETDAVFITDFRYVEQATRQIEGYEIVQHTQTLIEEVAKQVERLGIQKLGFEQDDLSYATFSSYEKALKTTLIPVSGAVEKLRLIKCEAEIKILKEAAEIADAAFRHILDFIRPGVREIDVANELEFFMRKQGATSSSFDIIVASGVRSALPHGVATEKVIEKGARHA